MKRLLHLFLLGACTFCAIPRSLDAQSPPSKDKLHLYPLIGQSNMAGRGVIEEEDKQPHARVLMFTKERSWAPALDPLHFDKPIAGVGLGTTFGKVMAEANPGITIGLVPCAVGGTPLDRWQKDKDLYDQALVRIKAAMKDGTLKGILWHQGESDASDLEKSKSYAARLAAMLQDWRKDLDAPDVPFVAGKLGEFLAETSKDGKPSHWKLVNEQLSELPALVKNTAVVDSSGLKHKGDVVHFDSASLRELGRRYAAAMQKLQGRGAAASGKNANAEGDSREIRQVEQNVDEMFASMDEVVRWMITASWRKGEKPGQSISTGNFVRNTCTLPNCLAAVSSTPASGLSSTHQDRTATTQP